MEKQRIQVYADPEVKHRVELAAAKYNIPVTEYCMNAIEPQLADDELLDVEQITIPVNPNKSDDTWIADLRALRERILADRGGKLIDIDDIIEQVPRRAR